MKNIEHATKQAHKKHPSVTSRGKMPFLNIAGFGNVEPNQDRSGHTIFVVNYVRKSQKYEIRYVYVFRE